MLARVGSLFLKKVVLLHIIYAVRLTTLQIKWKIDAWCTYHSEGNVFQEELCFT